MDVNLDWRFKAALLAAFVLLAGKFFPAPPDRSSPARDQVAFAAIGDAGTGQAPQFEVARQLKNFRDRLGFDFVLMLGDNIYPNGDLALVKSRFEEPYQELLKDGVKFYAVLGNHDARRGAAAQTRYANFNMNGRRYYSFTKEDELIEFFALDSTAMSAEQVAWLDNALEISKARWKVAFLHHPIYSSGRTHGSNLRLRSKLEPLFIRHRVDVVLAGHDHVYERIKPQHGVSYFTEGASGQLRLRNLNRRSPLFEAGNDEMHSFLIIQVDSSRMKIEAIGIDGATLDSVLMAKAK